MVAVMLTYLLGDVLRIFSGDFKAMGGMQDVTKGMFLGIAVLMVIPSVMVFLSLTLKANVNRWANIILGLIYTGIILITMFMPEVWAHYYFVGIIEVVLTALIVWYAWNWPKQEA
jgi:hypothetical protein